jgi:hypothetical protein
MAGAVTRANQSRGVSPAFLAGFVCCSGGRRLRQIAAQELLEDQRAPLARMRDIHRGQRSRGEHADLGEEAPPLLRGKAHPLEARARDAGDSVELRQPFVGERERRREQRVEIAAFGPDDVIDEAGGLFGGRPRRGERDRAPALEITDAQQARVEVPRDVVRARLGEQAARLRGDLVLRPQAILGGGFGQRVVRRRTPEQVRQARRHLVRARPPEARLGRRQRLAEFHHVQELRRLQRDLDDGPHPARVAAAQVPSLREHGGEVGRVFGVERAAKQTRDERRDEPLRARRLAERARVAPRERVRAGGVLRRGEREVVRDAVERRRSAP